MSVPASSMYARFDKYVDKTFNEAAARYLAELQARDMSRIARLVDSVRPYVGHMRLIDIDDESVQQFKQDRALGRPPFRRPAMVGTINKELTQIVTILNRACRIWRWLPSAPKLVSVTGDQRVAYPITWEEQDRLFRFLPTGWDVGAALFAVNTGARKEEIFGLKWADEVKVPQLDAFVFILNRTKNGESRAVICNSIARRAVNHQRKFQAKYGQSDFVFPRDKSAPTRCRPSGNNFQKAWLLAGLPEAKLVRKGIHNLRHTFGHRLRSAGVSQENRNALLGHARTNLAEHYALPDLVKLFEAAELVTIRSDTTILRCQPGAPSTRA